MEDTIAVVRGRRVERVPGVEIRRLTEHYESVVVDLGTGDGRWLYRLARSRPATLCLGIDADVRSMREVSHRVFRKPARGGLPNIRFISAAADSLPPSLTSVADEVWVIYPWGSLLRAVLAPEPSVLRGIADVLRPGGLLRVAINESVVGDDAALRRIALRPRSPGALIAALRAGYNEAGLTVGGWRTDDGARVRSSWAGRLGQGGGLRTVWVEAVRDGDGRDHGRRRDRAGAAGPGAPRPAARRHRDGAGVPAV